MGEPFPSPGDLPSPEIKLGSSALQADSLPSEPPGKAKDVAQEKKKSMKYLIIKFYVDYMSGL